jgi:hypothetical protein
MLIQKLSCPFGCKNSIFAESTRTVASPNSNLLFDAQRQAAPTVEKVKVYQCQCCGNTFETHAPATNGGRMIL